MKDPITLKWLVEVSKDEKGYLTVRVNPDVTLRELRRGIRSMLVLRSDLPAKELMAVIDRALTDYAGQYVVYAGSVDPLWLNVFKELTGGK